MVELDELAGRGGAHAGEEARGVAPGEVAPLPGPRPSAEERAGAYVSEHDALPEDPADGGLGAALGAESVVHLDPAESVERVRGRGLVDLDGAVGEVSLGIELRGSVILLIVENQGYPNRRPDAAHARHRGVPAEPAIRPRCGRYAPFAWADSRPIPRRDQSVFPWLREIHMCLN